MKKLFTVLNTLTSIALLTSCAGSFSGLWGAKPIHTLPAENLSTPTLDIPPSFTPAPLLSPTASITALNVIPMPVSATPSQTPTITVSPTISQTPTITTSPSPGPPTRIPTYTLEGATLPAVNSAGPMATYMTQGGDTLNFLAKRFGILPAQIISAQVLPPLDELLLPGTLLLVPRPADDDLRTPPNHIIPDCEFVNGPTSLGFVTIDYVHSQGGYLTDNMIEVGNEGKTAGAQAVDRLALDNSISPRLILALVEYETHWVLGKTINDVDTKYPLKFRNFLYTGLYGQLRLAVSTLEVGYYSWRSGDLTEITFQDGTKQKLSPYLNAASVALQYYFAKTHPRDEWEKIVSPTGFSATYESMFGPSSERAQYYEPTLTYGLTQPDLSFPFDIGHVWAFTGGPHAAWEEQGALAALDFAPSSQVNGCAENPAWVVAPADGTVVRVGQGLVMLDLDGDGLEQTGWNIMFLHIASAEKVELGAVLKKNDHIGHPSCEGGIATGTHLHLARKYNGEWILADGFLPFTMNGWIAHNGSAPYLGTLTKGDKTVNACTCATFDTNVIRDK